MTSRARPMRSTWRCRCLWKSGAPGTSRSSPPSRSTTCTGGATASSTPWPTPRRRKPARRGSGFERGDLLVDGAEDALAVLALHLDLDGVAELHELGTGLAIEDRRSEEHTSELQSLAYLVCRLLL